MKNKKSLLLSVIAVVMLLVITIGVSYAFFSYTKKGTTENSIKTGTITFLYTEVTGVGKGIKIEDSLPISDDQGKLLTGSGNVFEFKITSDTLSNTSIPYEVTARKSSNSTLDEKAVKVYLTEVDGEESELLLDNYSNLKETDTNVPEGIVEKTLYKGKVPANTTKYEKNFKLRMWLDEGIDFSPVKDEDGNDTYPYNGKTFTLTVNVYANANVVTDNLDTTNTLDSITVSDCTLDPVFSSATTEYSCTVKNSVTSVTVNATATSSKSKVRGLGAKDLVEGINTLPIRVIAEDGSEKIYNVNVTRKGGVTSLKNEIMKNTVVTANPTLTTSSNNTNDASGLYKSTDTNSGDPTYYFRGNVTNNYVSFAGFTWRIVRINEDGTIRIVMQDGINNNNTKYKFNSNYNNYTYMYYSNSEAKTTLESWYQTNIGSKSNLAKNVASGNYYCEQAKVKSDDSYTSGSATMTTYNKYTPDFKCETDGNGKGQVNASVGLLTYDEVVYAGGYNEQSNSNYYLYNNSYFWTMSPAGFVGSFSIVWLVYTSGDILNYSVPGTSCLRAVLSLNADTLVTGTGTSSDPYVVAD